MTIGNALAFIKRTLKDAGLRGRLNGAANKDEIDSILKGEAMSFSACEFEDAYNHRLTECQTSEEAEALKELKLWWDLLGQIINPHECKAGCSGCF